MSSSFGGSKRIENEFQMAMLLAHRPEYWGGTSIVEGAIAILNSIHGDRATSSTNSAVIEVK